MTVTTVNNTTNIELTAKEEILISWAVDRVIEKFIAAGGNEKEMMSREGLDWFFFGLLCREGEEAVKDFINDWEYTPPRKRIVGYC